MPSSQLDIAALKARMKDTWMAGDFGMIARYSAKAAEEFVERLKVNQGSQILDVACGNGNTAIPEARAGARVTGVDIATNLLEQARIRAQREGLDIDFREGDAEQLPFPDASFDTVVSMFGAMFAPRPELVAAELLRVCRSGGMIAMANWTSEGFTGQMFKITGKYVPPPAGLPAPVLWGDEATIKQRFAAGVKAIDCNRIHCDFEFPFPPAQVVQFFRQYFGPTQAAFARLDGDAQATLTADLEKHWSDNNQAGGGKTRVRTEYLEAVATRT